MRVYMRWGKTADTIMSEYASDIALDLHRRLQSVYLIGRPEQSFENTLSRFRGRRGGSMFPDTLTTTLCLATALCNKVKCG